MHDDDDDNNNNNSKIFKWNRLMLLALVRIYKKSHGIIWFFYNYIFLYINKEFSTSNA
jgi:hypothetical protein